MIALLAVSTGSLARAQSVSQSFNIAPQQLVLNEPAEIFNFSVDPFDLSLGTLVSIDLAVNTDDIPVTGGVFTADNQFQIATLAQFSINSTPIDPVDTFEDTILPPAGSGEGDPATAFFTVGGSGTLTTGPLFDAALDGSPFDFSLDATFFASNGVLEPLTGGTVDITYNFVSVPEPAAGALVLLGLAVLPLRKR